MNAERTRELLRPLLAAALAVAVALALAGLATRHVPLGTAPTYMGRWYAQMARDPFHAPAGNPVALRFLAPLLSWAVGLRGPRLLLADQLAVVAFLAVAFQWLRGRGLGTWPATVGTATMAFSAASLVTLHYGGYPDTFTYLFVLLAFVAIRRAWLAALLFLLALFVHEGAAFLAPWFAVLLARRAPGGTGRWLRAAAWMAAALALFAGARWLLARAHPGPEYTFAYYLAPVLRDPLHWLRMSEDKRALGVLGAFGACWLLPPLAAAHLLAHGRRADALTLLLPVPLALAQLLVAYDVTRVTTLAFPSVLLAAEYLLRTGAWRSRWWMPALVAANALLPQVNVAKGVLDVMSR